MFLPESGECFMGPVVGRRLERLQAHRDGDVLRVHIRAEPPTWPREYAGGDWELDPVEEGPG